MPTQTSPTSACKSRHGALRQVVASRLNELGINPFEAARRGDLERSFVNDILIGKKHSVRTDKIGSLARALQIDPAELILSQSTPHGHRRPVAAVESVDTVLDHVCNWLAEHPRATCALVCAVALIPLMMDVPR
ncbi:hypothetical protein EOA60_04540 [Mesorhizobium sp. M1A.F.Ca.IN.020.06.1.1]|uniref:helix-turn-helix domain-containing protein n=1 Tax=unclassified Mesorhizobium TaxID=325217 RepID=UPI000FCAD78D|nr:MULTISPECIES: helix-turn-helix transcriptional regulator [unclassified Mesorhizobium]RUV84336.1 hypothetical protein EOA51_22200 [Mesorhizobium sp. M1A.F.Ca.IN.020.32.1.1]RUW13873.1 hypothetical protein EOA46_05260 [Mesorhizobium sp. M1A.F.Ca.IN.022.05.2.1]RUW35432.1 hypothetical protein EOA60_04540 [Mesorhizobium sp. M1A.F.Ca.IN.020.06.1.1]RWF81336.1 MAG: hypothetical protein EOQ35_14345 [Mesorhizobium sp.]RWG06170.1 MAG: hypothetical protein EOQ38_02015 [Mesorhizobium sp.]